MPRHHHVLRTERRWMAWTNSARVADLFGATRRQRRIWQRPRAILHCHCRPYHRRMKSYLARRYIGDRRQFSSGEHLTRIDVWRLVKVAAHRQALRLLPILSQRVLRAIGGPIFSVRVRARLDARQNFACDRERGGRWRGSGAGSGDAATPCVRACVGRRSRFNLHADDLNRRTLEKHDGARIDQ